MGRWEFSQTRGAMYTSLTGQEATLVERDVHQWETPWLSTSSLRVCKKLKDLGTIWRDASLGFLK